MTEPNAPATTPTVQLRKSLSYTIDPKSKTALMVFEIADGTQFAISIPLGGLSPLANLVGEVRGAAKKHGFNVGPDFVDPASFGAGHSDDCRGAVFLTFNEGTANEMIFRLTDADGMTFAKAIQEDIVARMTPDQRRRQKIITPPRPKLIT